VLGLAVLGLSTRLPTIVAGDLLVFVRHTPADALLVFQDLLDGVIAAARQGKIHATRAPGQRRVSGGW